MSLILHITDLHLGDVDQDQVIGDHKSEIVPLEQRVTRQAILETTLSELQEKVRQLRPDQQLDAVVVTGDVTVQGHESGFEKFESVLRNLGPILPPRDKIAVVPGNHDVTWNTPPSSSERYKNFVKFIKDEGYVTPALTESENEQDSSPGYILAPDYKWLIVPINSSNYCGSLEPLKETSLGTWSTAFQLPENKTREQRSELENARWLIKDLRQHDVARISPYHLKALRELLQRVDAEAEAAGAQKPVRIALVHHQLLPVSTYEEFKSYESIVNLGLFRAFLKDNEISIVLHGHKHFGASYWDYIGSADSPEGDGDSHRVLVVSGSTVGGDGVYQDACRLLEIASDPYAPSVTLSRVPGVLPGRRLPEMKAQQHPLWQAAWPELSPDQGVNVIAGDIYREVYARLRKQFEGVSAQREVRNLTCQIETAPTTEEIADEYPTHDAAATLNLGPSNMASWLDSLVQWWQLRETVLKERLHFTHGGRIYRYAGDRKVDVIDQFKSIEKALNHREDTSRAVAILLDPEIDEIGAEQRKFPAFCMVQFSIRDDGEGPLLLDCTGYFRKQEMRFWWPVNIAELAKLQEELHQRLRSRHRGLQIGRITTVSTLAYAAPELSRVAVPAVDRALDYETGEESKETLWRMVYALFEPSISDREQIVQRWERLLDSLVPEEKPDPDGVPIALDGLKYLEAEIERFASSRPSDDAIQDLLMQFDILYTKNQRYAVQTVSRSADEDIHAVWRRDVIRIVNMMRSTIAQMFNSNP